MNKNGIRFAGGQGAQGEDDSLRAFGAIDQSDVSRQ